MLIDISPAVHLPASGPQRLKTVMCLIYASRIMHKFGSSSFRMVNQPPVLCISPWDINIMSSINLVSHRWPTLPVSSKGTGYPHDTVILVHRISANHINLSNYPVLAGVILMNDMKELYWELCYLYLAHFTAGALWRPCLLLLSCILLYINILHSPLPNLSP